MNEPMTAVSTAYLDGNCTSSPVSATVGYAANCTEANCTALAHGQATLHYSTTCHTLNLEAYSSMSSIFAGLNYLVADAFADSECSTHSITRALGIQTCEPYELLTSNSSVVVSMTGESVQLDVFEDADCASSPTKTMTLDRSTLSRHSCYTNTLFNAYTNGSLSASSSSRNVRTALTSASASNDGSSSVETPVATNSSDLPLGGIVNGCLSFIFCVVALGSYRSWALKKQQQQQQPSQRGNPHTDNGSPATLERASHRPSQVQPRPATSSGNLWEDPVILAARIPRERLRLEHVLSCNSGGMVYSGTYNGQYVVVKKLLPERQHAIPRVTALLTEAKLLAALEHPHVVPLLGVAWNSLSDMSVVTEFMGGGTLKSLLIAMESQRCSLGVTHLKVQIALHVAQALAYLHSRAPPVVHRSLNSCNVLLSETLDAKLANVGRSHKRLDQKTLLKRGSAFWTAPEVMLGERYDGKADVFSFGVLLAEIDLHSTPFAASQRSAESVQSMPSAVVQQMVKTGTLRAEFSEPGLTSMLELGIACVAVD
ncbi:hypothetical protein BBJ28_00025791, partial [Nothophytophthora sp. Chile5]